jgi:DNA polymerase III sliding clamp (beta) subunit (PCNA family)
MAHAVKKPKIRKGEPLAHTLAVDPDVFLAALTSVGMLARESSPVKIELNGVVRLSSSSPDLGTSSMELTTATWDGPDMVAAYNPQYLGDALKISRGGKLRIRDGLKPAMVEGDVTSLVMPVRLPAHID